WRLGHSLAARGLGRLFSLEGPGPAAPPEPARRRRERPNQAALRPGTAWLIAVVTLILAIILVADGAYEGFVPGGREWSTADNAGWVVYLFAAVTLTIAVRAVHGGRIALRALMVVALILFLERSFSPFSLREQDPVVLALHRLAALVSLAVAVARSLDLTFSRVQCTPDLVPSDITGISMYDQRAARFEYLPGPLAANVVLVDEINRATPRAQSALLEAMQERQITVDQTTHRL